MQLARNALRLAIRHTQARTPQLPTSAIEVAQRTISSAKSTKLPNPPPINKRLAVLGAVFGPTAVLVALFSSRLTIKTTPELTLTD